MKIKNWLMVSHLVVMLLPIVAVYLLYVSLQSYNQEEDLKEYLDFQILISDLDRELNDASLYESLENNRFQALSQLGDDHLRVDLYRYDGLHLFTTMEGAATYSLPQDQDRMFENLNETQRRANTYVYKKPVLDENQQLSGVYEITLGRTDWVETSNQQLLLTFILSGIFFILLYIIVIVAINRKLNRPLHQLQEHMRAFAAGKDTDKKLNQSKDEIGALNQQFEEMKNQIMETREELVKEQEEKEYMVAALSHDLKTPLTVIRTYTEALENHHLSKEERAEYQMIVNDKLTHMKQMIDDLSIFTALQSSKNTLQSVQVNGNEFFEMLFSGYEEPCARKDIRLTTEWKVRNAYELDPKQMIRLVDNLMDNSIRYTPQHRQIWLAAIASTKPLPDWIFPAFKEEVDQWREAGTVILIQNEGKGMAESQLQKVFEPFYQDDASRGKGATSGLGLSIAKIIMENHEGKINIWSSDNEGTLFACWIKERG
ncbi:HAMP domain-containing sensor histidine kinase [Oceanobacillus jeddahense]|uniref:histidine kinase n=1 Tax=Oceanobacillus jeddahense TaxID=1462527 RepID=A0ABY5K0K7_9BACI|nr:HAMP domain-containing sensor histidine kinase [Oceanobacillus jeddahense]UUI04928.1 HAMP domain-containing histidine kinase [Oceanobacillus jeddahense]